MRRHWWSEQPSRSSGCQLYSADYVRGLKKRSLVYDFMSMWIAVPLSTSVPLLRSSVPSVSTELLLETIHPTSASWILVKAPLYPRSIDTSRFVCIGNSCHLEMALYRTTAVRYCPADHWSPEDAPPRQHNNGDPPYTKCGGFFVLCKWIVIFIDRGT